MRECEELFGHNYGRSDSDQWWDCIHIIKHEHSEVTLCNTSIDAVAQAVSIEDKRNHPDRVHAMNACWTCLGAARRIIDSPLTERHFKG
jgi:hypothetical protein